LVKFARIFKNNYAQAQLALVEEQLEIIQGISECHYLATKQPEEYFKEFNPEPKVTQIKGEIALQAQEISNQTREIKS
jgi:3-isopropylmalate dehydratase small subunit